MDIEKLKSDVCKANLDLVKQGLVTLTWGNVSGIDRERGLLVIKPSGIPYEELTSAKMALVRLSDGRPEKGSLKPSSDTPTHIALYREFSQIGGIVHTHSLCATAFAQALRPIPCLGTTHADSFNGEIPVTRKLKSVEIQGDYEANTGKLIIETFKEIEESEILHIPAMLVAQHGPFSWGCSPEKAVENAIVLEQIAGMALRTLSINPSASSITQELLDKHFLRKHGKDAYYGQL